MRHLNLGALTHDQILSEVAEASQWLMRHLPEKHIPVIAYPYGLSPGHGSLPSPASGVRFGLRVEGGWQLGHKERRDFSVPRWNVPSGVSDSGFSLRLRGWLAR